MDVVVRVSPVVDDPRDLDLLDVGERARAARRSDPLPFVRAHALLRRMVADRLGQPAEGLAFSRRCTTCGSERHGKPSLDGHESVRFSVSYAGDLVLVALAESVDVGVDLEVPAATDFDGFPRVTLAPGEEAGFDGLVGDRLLAARALVWARKEAILKATGHGLVVDPGEIQVSAPDAPPTMTGWSADALAPAHVTLVDLDVAGLGLSRGGHRGALAILDRRTPTIDLAPA